MSTTSAVARRDELRARRSPFERQPSQLLRRWRVVAGRYRRGRLGFIELRADRAPQHPQHRVATRIVEIKRPSRSFAVTLPSMCSSRFARVTPRTAAARVRAAGVAAPAGRSSDKSDPDRRPRFTGARTMPPCGPATRVQRNSSRLWRRIGAASPARSRCRTRGPWQRGSS